MFRLTTLTALCAGACTSAAFASAVGPLLDKHTVARGGRSAIEAVRTIEIDLRISEPGHSTFDGTYRATRTGRMRIDIYADGRRVYTEGLNGERAWSMPSDAREGTPSPPAAAAALQHGLEMPFKLYGLHEATARGHRLRQLEDETLDGVKYNVVQLTFDDDYEVKYYFKDCGLIERDRQRRAQHVEADPTPQWIETRYADYRAVGGVMYPFRQSEHVVETGELLSSSVVTSIRVNPTFEDRQFERPAASDAPRRGSWRGMGRTADTWL